MLQQIPRLFADKFVYDVKNCLWLEKLFTDITSTQQSAVWLAGGGRYV